MEVDDEGGPIRREAGQVLAIRLESGPNTADAV
jgi:hypothetical protein